MSTSGERQGDISLDNLFRALGHPARRQTLMALTDRTAIEREELESMLAPRGGQNTEAVRTRLYHYHFPHLNEVGLIDWDRQADTVERGSNFEAVRLHVNNGQDLQ